MARIIIFTGKGGVGKTSIAAAHARKASLDGKRTLIVSTDMAHNLSDLFEHSIGREPVSVTKNLDALEIDPYYEMEKYSSNIVKAMNLMFPKSDGTANETEDLMMLPGVEELFSLMKIQQLNEAGGYDVIIVDCAPTGETLSLLMLPELLGWYMEKIFPIEKVAMKMLRPISKKAFQIVLPDGKTMNDIEGLYYELVKLQQMIRDRDHCSIRIVAVPEKMVVEECKKNYMYMNLYNFNVDGLMINRVIPKNVENEFFTEWIALQRNYIRELQEVFGEIPTNYIIWYDHELTGLESLDRVVEDSLLEKDLLGVRTVKFNEIFEKTATGYELRLFLPSADRKQMELNSNGQEVLLKIGNYKRSIPLPNALRSMDISSAKFVEDTLVISME